MILFWILPFTVALHITEEFVYPGGFRRWYRNYKPKIASSLTTKFLVTVNSILIIICIIPILISDKPQGAALWLTIVAILFSNSLFHIAGGIRSRQYSPGIITSIIFYLPMSIFGYWFFISTEQASFETALFSFLLGSAYQWWSLYNHQRRSKANESKNEGT